MEKDEYKEEYKKRQPAERSFKIFKEQFYVELEIVIKMIKIEEKLNLDALAFNIKILCNSIPGEKTTKKIWYIFVKVILYTPIKVYMTIYKGSILGSGKFAMSCLVYFNNGSIVLVDLDATPSAFPEEILKNFIIRNAHWNPYVVNFEQEPGSDSTYALKHWQMN